ncbi:MAG: hypothetical protein ACR2QE_17365 [Acidimicrobiales bacterium]
MTPSELSLFTSKEQEMLVATEPRRLDKLSEDELVALLGRVRRARNKYSDLHRRQGANAVRTAGKRYASTTSNTRTVRKAEILEDAVSRVARYVSRAARRSADAIKDERLAAARKARSKGKAQPKAPSKKKRPANTKKGKSKTALVPPQRKGATSAANKRQQAAKDNRR